MPNVLTGTLDVSEPVTELHLAGGETVRLATAILLASDAAGSAVGAPAVTTSDPLELSATADLLVIPVVGERLDLGKRTVPTGVIRIHKTVQAYQTALDEPLAVRTFEVERIVLNQPVDVAPAIRHEGSTTVYPLVEEQLILTKQLVLKEELRVTQRDTERRDTQVVTLRREHIEIERESLH